MPQKDLWSSILLALLVYLPTCAFVPGEVYVLLIGFSIYLNWTFVVTYITNLVKFKITDKSLTLLLLFSFSTLILRISDYQNWTSIQDIYSFAYLFPFTYLVAKAVSLRKECYTFIIYFITIEAIVGVLEYAVGVSSFYSSLEMYREFESYDLLYYTRVFGLSGNSSGFSLKLVFGLILLSLSNFNKWKYLAIESLLLFASIITFGRIALIVILFYYFIKLFDSVFVSKTFKKLEYLPILIFILFFSVNPNWTKNQFTRNNMKVANHEIIKKDGINPLDVNPVEDLDYNLTNKLGVSKINMAGRNNIWNSFITYGINNIFTGHKGKKFLLNEKVHAHNSYIEVFASFGIVLFIVLLYIFGRPIDKNNYVLILPLMLLACGQYLIFWGISFFDVIFYSILFFQKPINEK